MDEPVKIPITNELDLHTFRPAEVRDLLDEYFMECVKKGIFSVRVIHGKGGGILKKRVQAALIKNPRVRSFADAPPSAGGWGATLVTLRREQRPSERKEYDFLPEG